MTPYNSGRDRQATPPVHNSDTAHPIAGISGTVWLAHYDLGVRQHFDLVITPDEENICNIHIMLKRETGQERTWWRLNRAFLASIRKQLLGWRRIPTERIMKYVKQANHPDQEPQT
jgi:hypothetical protein